MAKSKKADAPAIKPTDYVSHPAHKGITLEVQEISKSGEYAKITNEHEKIVDIRPTSEIKFLYAHE